jgi:hypothetical protein
MYISSLSKDIQIKQNKIESLKNSLVEIFSNNNITHKPIIRRSEEKNIYLLICDSKNTAEILLKQEFDNFKVKTFKIINEIPK